MECAWGPRSKCMRPDPRTLVLVHALLMRTADKLAAYCIETLNKIANKLTHDFILMNQQRLFMFSSIEM